MTKAELAQALGISASMVSRLAKRGMPVDCVERAKRWRRRHIETGRMKGVRFDPRADEQRQAVLNEAVQAATLQAGPHLRESLGLLDEAIGAALRRMPEDQADVTAALEGLRDQFMALVVGRCGGLDKAALHWWYWCALLPPELAEDDDICQHLDDSCPQPVTLLEFHRALEPTFPVPVASLQAEFLRL